MQRGCSRQEFGMLQREMFLVESEDKMVSRKLLQSRARRMKPTPADFDVFRLLYKHAIRPANELQLRKGRLVQFASTCPALIPVLINIFADREDANSSQHSQFPVPSSSLARMGSRIPQSEPLWWVDRGTATALCIRQPPQRPLFLPALPLRAQIATCDYRTFAINTTRLSPI